MDGLSPEERRARALKMLKAKPRAQAVEPKSDREKELEERERELAERAQRIEVLERTKREEALERDRQEAAAERERQREEELEARERDLQDKARELEERERELSRQVDGENLSLRGKSATNKAETPRRGAPAETSPGPTVDERRPRERQRRDPSRTRARTAPRETPPPAAAAGASAKRKARPKAGGTLLSVASLNVHYGKIQALRGLDLAIKPGEVVALLGANGAGKSSTLRAISGMIVPSAGEIIFDGEPIGGLPAFEVVKHGISHVPEGRELFPTLTVEENLRLGYWPQRKTGSGTLQDALDRVYAMFPRLGERRAQAAGTMSGGEQQMLAFGRALTSSPKLLLVDEMSLGLAPLIVQTLFDAVEQIHSEGASVIIVEQFVHKALRHAQRAYVLSKGEVVLEAPSSKLANDPNLLAAYLGGAEGHIEEGDSPAPARGEKSRK